MPKDVKAFVRTGGNYEVPMQILAAADQTNDRQKRVLVAKVVAGLCGEVEGLGWASSGGSHSSREPTIFVSRPRVALIDELLAAGVTVVTHDPAATSRQGFTYSSIGRAACVFSLPARPDFSARTSATASSPTATPSSASITS